MAKESKIVDKMCYLPPRASICMPDALGVADTQWHQRSPDAMPGTDVAYGFYSDTLLRSRNMLCPSTDAAYVNDGM